MTTVTFSTQVFVITVSSRVWAQIVSQSMAAWEFVRSIRGSFLLPEAPAKNLLLSLLDKVRQLSAWKCIAATALLLIVEKRKVFTRCRTVKFVAEIEDGSDR